MTAQALGYVDELIRHLESGKKIFQQFDVTLTNRGTYIKPPREWAAALASSPKFTLPTLGQFYRPLSDFQEIQTKASKFSMYAEDYELDMLEFPPFERFVLEFRGFDEHIKIKYNTGKDIIFDKYVLFCSKFNGEHSSGIVFHPFYHCYEGLGYFPDNEWGTVSIPFILVNSRTAHPNYKGKFAPVWNVVDPTYFSKSSTKLASLSDYQHDVLYSLLTGMWPEVRAIYQFMVVMNVKQGVVTTEVRTPRSKVPTLRGRNTGYSYRVLEIDPSYVAPISQELGGTHASPRFHLRRAHLRHFQDGTFTFVRQAQVGSPLIGTVGKDYKIKPWE